MAKKDEILETENNEWIESIRWVIENASAERVQELHALLSDEINNSDIQLPVKANTDYKNTIPVKQERPYPGNLELEKKITAYIRWNAMAIVVKANKESDGIGGHISTYASIADLYEVGFNHFFKVYDNGLADMIYFQGHAAPGVYARSFLEGKLSKKQLYNFRRELGNDGGLPSYPHPRFMPDYWGFPTVSMGLAPIMGIYQARFSRYLLNRKLISEDKQRVWVYLGDGEMDEPESTGAIAIAAREKLDNLTFVINCNLQRLDGPVRGNGKIVQELEGVFTGAGWNVIKVLWGSEWDEIFENDKENKLLKLLNEMPDGQLQKFAASDGKYLREQLFGGDKELAKLVERYSDQDLLRFKRGGHDPVKIYNAYKAATEHKGRPTVILAQTIKGYGQGKNGEASNVTHQQKKMDKEGLKYFRDRFAVPLSDDDLEALPFIKPSKDSEETTYLLQKRKDAGGFIPVRTDNAKAINEPDSAVFERFFKGTGKDKAATTMVMVQLLTRLLNDKSIGRLIVPIIPDESRTFGMESLFRKVGIYNPDGQQYDPVDKDSLMYYKEAKDGAILEEGITEAGSASSFIAAGTAYATYGVNTIPFFFFYSMFGFQRIGDLIWAAADAHTKGFLCGGVSGRTSLPGEGLQHADGQSQLFALAYPNVMAYDPAFAYEVALIVQDGIKRMYVKKESIFYYLSLANQTYQMPEMPKGVEDGVLKGLYRFKESKAGRNKKKAHLFGSGAVMTEVLKAADILQNDYKVSTDVWSITSYKLLYEDAVDTERKNVLGAQLNKSLNYIQQTLKNESGVFVAASDYVKAIPQSIANWFPDNLAILGTDGFGRSDNYEAMRKYFEVDCNYIVYITLYELAVKGIFSATELKKAAKKLGIEANKDNPRKIV